MIHTARRAALTAAALVSANVLSLPFASPARAATPSEPAFVIGDRDNDGGYGLRIFSNILSVSSAETIVIPEAATVDVRSVSTSRDGSRAIFILDTYASDGITPLRERVVVADVSGRLVRTVEDIPASDTVYDLDPVLSPDGSTAMWTRVTETATSPLSIRRVGVASGSATTFITGLGFPVFLSPSVLLGQNMNGAAATLPIGGGAQAGARGLPLHVSDVTVSADGTHAAWSVPSGSSYGIIQTSTLSLSSGAAIFGTPVSLTSSQTMDMSAAPAFSRDGSKIFFAQGSGGKLYNLEVTPSNGSGPTSLIGTGYGNDDISIGLSDDGTAPGALASLPALLNGTSTKVQWALPSDTDLSGVLLTRKFGSTVQRSDVLVPAPLTYYVDSGLTLGSTYTYELRTVDRSGNVGPLVTRDASALLPTLAFADPTSLTSVKPAYPVTFAAAATASAKFYVQYLPSGSTTWYGWVNGATGRVRTFGAPATTNVASTTSIPGMSYSFRAQIKDAYGNSTAPIVKGRAVVPFDQTKAYFSGGTAVSNSSAYIGSYRKLWATSQYAKVTLTGNRLQIVGVRCTSCGKLAVYDGSTLVATVDSYATSTRVRQLLFTKTYSSIGTHTFTIRPKATSGRPNVLLDGFAMRR